MKRKPIDVEELKKVFRLKDGTLERLRSYPSTKWVLVKNNGTNNGYCQVRFNSMRIYYHTIVWVLTTGEDIPEGMQIDHINGNRIDNRFENLRLVTDRGNNQNRKVHRKGKLVGCYFDKHKGRYEAKIRIGKKVIHLGRYATEEEAHNIYVSACKHIEEYIDNASFRELINKDQK
jgi:hypothetical protein